MADFHTAPYGTGTGPASPIQPAVPQRTTGVPMHGAGAANPTMLQPQTTTGPGATIIPISSEPAVYSGAPGHHGHAHGHNNRPSRGFIVGTLASIAFVFWLIAMTTPIGMIDGDESTTGKLTVDPWHACTRLTADAVAFCRPMGHPDEPCTGTRDAFRVEEAFLLLTGIMLIPLLTCAALDFSHKLDHNTPDLPFGLHTHGWMVFFAFVTALVSCVAFAVGFAIPRSDPCNNGSMYEQADFEWGPSPVFSLLIFLLSIAMIIVALILREDGTVVKHRDEITHHHQHHPGGRPLGAGSAAYSNAPAYGHGVRRGSRRGTIVTTLTSIAVVFWLIAMTTPIGMIDGDETDTGKVTVDPWHSCSRLTAGSVNFCRPMGHPDEPCTGTRDAFRVEQAFLLLTGIMLIPLLACAALDLSHKLYYNTPDLPFGLHTHGWTIFFGLVTALVSCVAFAVGFAIPRSDPCNNGSMYEQADFEWGPSPVFSLLIFLCSLAIIVVALILRKDGSVKTREEIPRHENDLAEHQPMTSRPAEPVAP